MEGDYVERLVVSDGELESPPDTVVISSINGPPVADAGADRSVSTDTEVTLEGGGSYDPNGDPLYYSWLLLQKPQGSATNLSNSSAVRPTLVPDRTGQYVVQLEVNDGRASSAPDNVTIAAWPSVIYVPGVLGMTQAEAQGALVSAGLSVGNVTTGYSDTVASGRVMGQNPGYNAAVSREYPVDIVVSSGPVPQPPPPDPATVAPAVPVAIATTVAKSTEFLFSGSNPIQTGVAPGTIDPKRLAVVRGNVKSADGALLSGVAITVLNHPELGRTLSRADGMFDLAVNGGGEVVITYLKPGFLPVHRQAQVRWQDYTVLPDVRMTPIDNQVTQLDLSSPAPIQVARGNVVTDGDGTRQATLMISQGTQAQLAFPDGSSRPVPSLKLRLTEYTVGPNGRAAMPAPLPPSTAYTYAVELSADEAIEAGAETMRFSQPYRYYVENFLGFPSGTSVPVGYYDRKKGVWVPEQNGVVLKIVGVTEGLADLDIDGDNVADNTSILEKFLITSTERAQLASQYAIGTSLMRALLSHMSTFDLNMAIACLNENFVCTPPQNAGPVVIEGNDPSYSYTGSSGGASDCQTGSIIECPNQGLGESIPIAGTPLRLNYRNTRVPGYKATHSVDIQVTGNTVPDGVRSVELSVTIAGRSYNYTYDNTPNRTVTFVWDGLDAYGREVYGSREAGISIGYVYDYVMVAEMYRIQPSIDWWNLRNFGQPVPYGDIVGNVVRQGSLNQSWSVTLEYEDARGKGLGGWTLDNHHAYDPLGRMLYKGDGTKRDTAATGRIISTVADGIIRPWGLAVAPDGTIFVSGSYEDVVYRIDPAGNRTVYAGIRYQSGPSPDGIPATSARLSMPTGLALDREGNLYIAEFWNNKVRKVSPDGIIHTVAGNGECGYAGVGGVATDNATLCMPTEVAVGPDGSLYVVNNGYGMFRRVATDNIITAMGGFPMPSYGGVTVAPDGTIYYAGGPYGVFRIIPDGTISRIADFANVDGRPLVNLNSYGISVAPDGRVYFSEGTDWTIREIESNGGVRTIAGIGRTTQYPEDGISALIASIPGPYGIAFGPDGILYVSEYHTNRIRKIAPAYTGMTDFEITVPSEDGRGLFRVLSG